MNSAAAWDSPTEELRAREQVRDTIATCAHAGDSFQLDTLAEQFTEDGVLEIAGQATMRGRTAIKDTLAQQAKDGAPDADFFVRHFVANVLFRELAPELARVASYFTVLTPLGPDHWGRYRDDLVPVDGRWLLRQRTVRVDGSVPGGWYRRAFELDS